jgi:hypothetical protein
MVSVNVVVEVSGNAGEYQGSLKPHLYVDAVEVGFHAEYMAFAGKTTIAYNVAVPQYEDSSVHIIMLSLEATSGVEWSVDAKQAVLIVNASNVQDEYGEYVGVHVFSETIKGIDFKYTQEPIGVEDSLSINTGENVDVQVFNETIRGVDFKYTQEPTGIEDSLNTNLD